jgi:hypothetical protein
MLLRRAKFYRLTPAGSRQLKAETEKWSQMTDVVDGILSATREREREREREHRNRQELSATRCRFPCLCRCFVTAPCSVYALRNRGRYHSPFASSPWNTADRNIVQSFVPGGFVRALRECQRMIRLCGRPRTRFLFAVSSFLRWWGAEHRSYGCLLCSQSRC